MESSTSSPPNDQTRSLTFLPLTHPSLSPPPSLTAANLPSETSPGQFTTTEPHKSLNVIAIVIGVTGAAVLIVCAGVIFYLRKKQKKKVPPSAEFMDVAIMWKPRTYRPMDSPTSLSFVPKVATSSASPLEPMRYRCPVTPYTPTPTTPPWPS